VAGIWCAAYTRAEERVIGGSQIGRRTVVAAAVAPFGGLTAVAATAALWGRLPEPIAMHWSVAGRPDGSAVRGAGVALLLGVAVVSGLSSCALVLLGLRGAGALAGVGAMFSWAAWCTIVANDGAATWSAAGSLPFQAVLPGVAGAAAVAVAVERGVVPPPLGGSRYRPTRWAGAVPVVVAVVASLVLMVVDAWAAVGALVALAVGVAVRSPVGAAADAGGSSARPRARQPSGR